MLKETWIELGRKSDQMIGFSYEKERGIGIAGNSGTGKTNLTLRILTQILEKKNDIEVHIYSNKVRFMYKKLNERFDNILEVESKTHKIRAALNRLSKEIDRRKRKLKRNDMSIDEMRNHVKGSEVENWNEKFVIIDDFSILLIKLREKGKQDQLDKFIDLATKVVNEGPEVGIKTLCVFLRNVNFDAPKEIVDGLTLLGSTNNNMEDYKRWELVVEGDKLPKKNGEVLINNGEFKGFIKTYNINKYIEEREGIFNKWDPYSEMYKEILSKLK